MNGFFCYALRFSMKRSEINWHKIGMAENDVRRMRNIVGTRAVSFDGRITDWVDAIWAMVYSLSHCDKNEHTPRT